MKSSRAAIRRALVLAGAVAVASMVAVAIPQAASAHHPIVTGSADCDAGSGTWKVTWTVENSEWDITGTLTDVVVTPSGSTVTNISAGAILPTSREAPLTGVQILPGTATRAGLQVTAFWQRPGYSVTRAASASVELRGTCQIPAAKPAATFASHCEGSVTATLINGADATKAAAFRVTAEGGFERTASVDPNSSATVDIPAANAGTITVKVGRTIVATGMFEDPKDCAAPQTTVASTCDSLSLSVSNPDGGRVVTGSLTPSVGDAVAFTLNPGEEKTASFTGSDGLTVAMAATGIEPTTVHWTKPASCQPALPETGSNLTVAISTGAALVIVGTGILFFFRRRRGTHARF